MLDPDMTSVGPLPDTTNAAAHFEQDMCDGSQARVGGMLSGKCGLVYCHMGAAKQGLQPLMDAVAMSDVPITQFLPTHMERTPDLINQGAKWIAAGGRVDLTCRTDEVHNNIASTVHFYCTGLWVVVLGLYNNPSARHYASAIFIEQWCCMYKLQVVA